MAKVIVTIAPEDGMFFEDILSFETENYIGIWDYGEDRFMTLNKSGKYFEPKFLKQVENLRELDDAVYEEYEEHITDVYDRTDYKIELN